MSCQYGPWLLLTAVVALAVGWSRVRLRDHTIGQVIAGTVTGVAVALPIHLVWH